MHRTLALFLVALPLTAAAQAPAAPAAPAPQAAAPSLGAPTPAPIAPAKRAKIEKLISLLGVDAQMQNILTSTKDSIHKFAVQRGSQAQNDAQKKLAADYVTQLDSSVSEILVWDQMKETLVQAYNDAFTDADLDACITFYSSPAGHNFVSKSPQITEKVGNFQQGLNIKLRNKIQAITTDFDSKYKAAATPALQPLEPPHPPASTSAPATTPQK